MNVTHKKVIKNQHYEKYWKLTLANTNFFKPDGDFIRSLELIVNHIDKYNLASKSEEELLKTPSQLNQDVVHSHELEEKLSRIFPKSDPTGASIRKQINQCIKLGFIKPYFKGYVKSAKEYIKANKTEDQLRQIFSDTVYQYASFNSSQTKDCTNTNQIKFLVNTLLNKKEKYLTKADLIGLMNMDISNKEFATDDEISRNSLWAKESGFEDRKYNQIRYIKSILKKMNLFEVGNDSEYIICLASDAKDYLPSKNSNVKRDAYRFANMKKEVYEESKRIYGRKVCWYTKKPSEGLVVSHIYASADALRNYDIDEAYDPNNALLLSPGDVDQYFDKHKMTFDDTGKPIFSDKVRTDFISESLNNNYCIDKNILNESRKKYLKIHNKEFNKRNKS